MSVEPWAGRCSVWKTATRRNRPATVQNSGGGMTRRPAAVTCGNRWQRETARRRKSRARWAGRRRQVDWNGKVRRVGRAHREPRGCRPPGSRAHATARPWPPPLPPPEQRQNNTCGRDSAAVTAVSNRGHQNSTGRGKSAPLWYGTLEWRVPKGREAKYEAGAIHLNTPLASRRVRCLTWRGGFTRRWTLAS